MEAQSVGVVLSGGGASATAHVGFLKALEEEGIPIDFITGTSMGAVIAAYYAAGYSVAEIEALITSEAYIEMVEGEIDDRFEFRFKEYASDASMITLKYSKGALISTSLPTNLINPVMMDYMMMEMLSQASEASNYNFDSLFIPFRCVAADIETKMPVVFDKGYLNVAVRASATYPFYVPPIRVDGQLLYDGGLYNNFPSDVLYEAFMPDVILGSKVTDNTASPNEDDLFSQLESMIRYKTNFEVLCDAMVIVEPESDIGTFDFDKIPEAIDVGYNSTWSRMDEIRTHIQRHVHTDDLEKRRKAFKSTFKPLEFGGIDIEGLDKSQKSYVRKTIGKNDETISVEDLKKKYFRVFADDKIKSIFPTALYDNQAKNYTLKLNVKKEKDIFLDFGGNFSSRPINSGFVGMRYNLFRKSSTTISANYYFGKFYGSTHISLKYDFSGKIPFSVQPEFTLNRWDYFNSFATFFEDVKPSFIVLNERVFGLKFKFPAGNKAQLIFDGDYVRYSDDYYQTKDFSNVDTTDQTVFEGSVIDTEYERSTLDRKYFAKQGTKLSMKIKHTYGREKSIPGSTTALKDTLTAYHQWVTGKIEYRNFFKKISMFRLGLHIEGVASTQPFFQNYIASSIAAPSFQPLPESKTFFINQHRAHNYVAGGLIGVMDIAKNFEARGEAYVFNAIGNIVSTADNQAEYDWVSRAYFMASSSLIYHTPIGPVSISANFYDYKSNPWSFVFNFGYMIFNRSPRN